MIAQASSPFEIDTVGFERFIAFSATDHGILYGLATVLIAVMAGWLASIVFRRD
jgi:putative transmembrane protein Alph_Pro_TM